MLESVIQNKIRCALSSTDSIVFRTNAGTFYQGDAKTVKRIDSIEYAHPIRILTKLRTIEGLPKGFSDLIVIDRKGIAFIETKNETGQARDEQIKFINRMKQLGHRAGFARSVEDAMKIVGGE